ncbi:MAG: pilus assembly protein [Phyllobacteriaceae bacterium]|nr:pilus assembly protein [Nitratireductor sp.]MCO5133406.1 pilus assembly protein [Phyllobacteriaceae bacterium]
MPKTVQADHNEAARKRAGFFSAPKIVRRFAKDQEGVTAIEFAMLAMPFFMLLMAIVETSLLFFAGQVLESSVDEVGRKIRTGQLDQTLTEDQLRDEICESAAVLFDCDGLLIDMQVVATYDELGDAPKPEDGEIDPSDFKFEAAGPKQIVMLTVVAEWPVFTNYLQQYLSGLNNGNAVLTGITAFKTEPYSS